MSCRIAVWKAQERDECAAGCFGSVLELSFFFYSCFGDIDHILDWIPGGSFASGGGANFFQPPT